MSQPTGRPPEEWVKRSDGTTTLNVIQSEVAQLVDKAATKNWVLVTIGACSVLVIGAAFFVSNTAAGDAKNVAAKVERQAADDVRQVRAETSAKVERIETKVDAIYKLLVEQKPRAEVRREAEQRTGE
jgi:hypothetical protein